MPISSFNRRATDLCSRTLAKRTKCSHPSLYNIAAHVELGCHQQELASNVQFPSYRLLFKPTQSRPYPILQPKVSSRTMSDDAYSSFLDQANQDTGASKASTKSKSAATKAVDTDVPITLQKVDQYYSSEADEPFEPVSLKWSGGNMPSESMQPRQALLLGPRDVDVC